MKNGHRAYKEIREEAKKVYREIEAYKITKHRLSLQVEQQENKNWDVTLYLTAIFHYKNNLTSYAKADRSFKNLIFEGATREAAEHFAQGAKKMIEENTINENVEVKVSKYEEIFWF